MEPNKKNVKILDRFIAFFIILFLLSISNSIFVNQLGYFGALILILARYFITRENQFKKTGLEYLFVWFLLAELLSAVFSGNNPQAYLYFSKRALLIPIIYTTLAACTDYTRIKRYFKIYIGASLVTILIYLYFSYKYFIYGLYNIKESGPSLFQYPITASEITSFTVVFLFAFAINEKVNLKNRIFLIIGFLLSLAALLSTYKRTGWIGVAAGIFVILLMKKQWKVLIPVCVLVIFAFFYSKNVHKIEIYSFNNSTLKKELSLNTKGMPYGVITDGDKEYISDFNNGIVVYNDTNFIKKVGVKAPIYSLTKWNDDYYVASCIDSRFFALKKVSDNFEYKDEFITPGFTNSFALGKYLYIEDSDSGLSVFRNPGNPADNVRYPDLNKFTSISADSSYLITFKQPDIISAYKLHNGLPEGKPCVTYQDNSDIDRYFYIDGKLFISDKKGLSLFSISIDKLTLLDRNKSISMVFTWQLSNNKLFAADSKGNFYELDYPLNNTIKVLFKDKLDSAPESIGSFGNNIILTYAKPNRLLSIIDPYNPSNRGRIGLWKAGFKMFKDHPVFGVGDIDLAKLYIQYKHPYDKEIQGHMHNNFVHELVTLGLFGFLAFCLIILKIILIDIKIYRETKDKPFISSYALGALGGLCAFLVSGLTEYNFGDHEIITIIWFTLGLNIALYYSNKKITENKLES
jgi:hypothetical protein